MESWLQEMSRGRVTRGRYEGRFVRFQPSVDEGVVVVWFEYDHPYSSVDSVGPALFWSSDMVEPV